MLIIDTMSKKEYTQEQMKELQLNSNVNLCTSKNIIYTDEFKIRAIQLDKRWFCPRDIFKDFWFPDYIVNWDIPGQSLKNWRYKVKKNWVIWLARWKKWRPKKERIDPSKMSKDEYIKYLEAKIAYQEALEKEVYKSIHWYYP